jgi:hypothetical protein
MDVMPGRYRFAVAGPTPASFIRTARIGGFDVLNSGFTIDGIAISNVEIVVSLRSAILVAGVVNDRQQPVPNATVAIVPDFPRQERFELYQSVKSDASGLAKIDGIVPGNYRVYVWEDIEPGAFRDPEVVRRYQAYARPVSFGESAVESVRVHPIPPQP